MRQNFFKMIPRGVAGGFHAGVYVGIITLLQYCVNVLVLEHWFTAR